MWKLFILLSVNAGLLLNAEQCSEVNSEMVCSTANEDRCIFPYEERFDCGYHGITEAECLERGCCHNSSFGGVPHCFFPETQPCDVPDYDRRDCGFYGISTEECEAKGCCHQGGGAGTPSCFPKTMDPFTQFQSNGASGHDIWVLTHRSIFSFTIQACHSVHLYLRTFAYSDDTGYRFVIGADGQSSKVSFQRYKDGEETHSMDHDVGAVLFCDQHRSFTTEWFDNTVWLREGDDNMLVAFEDPDILVVTEIRMYTDGTEGSWEFQNNMGRLTNVASVAQQTGDGRSLLFKEVWMELPPQETGLLFRVAAEKEVFLVLTENLRNVDQYAIEVALGIKENQMSHLWKRGTEEGQEIETVDLLQGTGVFVDLWVSWKDGHFQLGSGDVIGQGKILDQVFDPQPVRFVTLAHEHNEGQMAYVQFKKNLGYQYYVHTAVDSDGSENWENRAHFNTHSTYVFFTVQSCGEARVYLSTDTHAYRYEIIFGSDGNTVTSIAVYEQDGTRKRRNTPDILSCYDARIFWINWLGDHVVIGKGSRLDQQELINFYDSTKTNDITGLAFRTTETEGDWTIDQNLVYHAVFQPENTEKFNFWMSLRNLESANLRIKACENVHVVFSQYAGVLDNSCEVRLGFDGNSKSEIRDGYGGQVLKTYTQDRLLDCNRIQPFWFSWSDDYFRVGVGSAEIMNVPLDSFAKTLKVKNLGVASSSSLAEPLIEVTDPIGNVYRYFSKPENNRALTLISYRKFLVFDVRVCSRAVVYVSTSPDLSQAQYYEVHLGDDASGLVMIKQNGVTKKTTVVPNILSCSEMRSFWITWENKEIRVGTGVAIYENEVLSYTDSHTFLQALHALHFETNDAEDGQWLIGRDYGVNALVTTEARETYNNIWLNVDQQAEVIFSLKARDVAFVMLSTMTGTPGNFDSIKIELANVSRLYHVGQNTQDELTSAATSGILSVSEDRYFWVSWYGERLEVGQGTDVARSVVLSYTMPSHVHFINMAVSSGIGVGQADWSFVASEANFAQLKTAALYYEGFKFVRLDQVLKFKLQACREANIVMFLGNDYSNKAYTLVIGGRDNAITYIKKGDDNNWDSEQELQTPGILSCFIARDFKLSWGPGGISLQSEQYYFSWVDTDYTAFSFFSFATDGVIGEWYFDRSAGDKYTVTTYDGELRNHNLDPAALDLAAPVADRPDAMQLAGEYKYAFMWLSVTDQTSIRFTVKACAEAHVILAKYYGIADFDSYEIRIGEENNKKVSIYKDRTVRCFEDVIENLLDCQTYKTFWVQWKEGLIHLGEGHTVGEQQLLRCQAPNFHVTGLSMSTDRGEDGLWIFEDFRGDELLSFWTVNDYPYWKIDRAWIVPRQDWVTFEVQTNEWIVIALTEEPWEYTKRCHQVHIGYENVGSDTHQVSYIIDCDDNEFPKASVNTPNVLIRGALTAFWISWRDQKLVVGYGYGRYSGAEMMSLPYNLPYAINGLGFATPKANSKWQLPQDLARQCHIDLPNDTYTYSVMEMSIRGLSSLVFQAKSKASLHLSLVSLSGSTDYSLEIGADSNTQTLLKDADGKVLVTKETANILNPDEVQVYWLRWSNGHVAFGQGGDVGIDLIVTYSGVLETFQRVLFTGSRVSMAHILIVEPLGQTYNLLTSEDWGYNVAWLEVIGTDLHFRVRACADAHILLATELNNLQENKIYEIVLGGSGNTYLYLRKGALNNTVAYAGVQQMLDCDALRRFYVAWEGGRVTVGSGDRHQGHVYLTYDDPDPVTVNYAAVSSGFGSVAEWEIQHTQSEGIIIYTPSEDDGYQYEDSYITLQGQSFVTFDVKACSNAQVALSEVPSLVTVATFEVILGYNSGADVAMRVGTSGEYAETVRTERQILSCSEYKRFWVSWTLHEVQVGEGEEPGKNQLIRLVPDLAFPFPINAVAFKTGVGVSGEWRYLSTGVNPSGSGGLSGGAIAGIVIGVLLFVCLAVTCILIFVPPLRIKAHQYYLAAKSKVTRTDPMFVDPTVVASEVGFESSA